jgi:hypothetical protein
VEVVGATVNITIGRDCVTDSVEDNGRVFSAVRLSKLFTACAVGYFGVDEELERATHEVGSG